MPVPPSTGGVCARAAAVGATAAASAAPSRIFATFIPSALLVLLDDLHLDADAGHLLVRRGEPELQRARARDREPEGELAVRADRGASLQMRLAADDLAQLDLRALRRRHALVVDQAGQPAAEAV